MKSVLLSQICDSNLHFYILNKVKICLFLITYYHNIYSISIVFIFCSMIIFVSIKFYLQFILIFYYFFLELQINIT